MKKLKKFSKNKIKDMNKIVGGGRDLKRGEALYDQYSLKES